MRVSEYYDIPIFDDHGRHVGEVQDVVLDFDDGTILGLGFGHKGNKVKTVPYDSVMAVNDIVIVKTGKRKPAKELGEKSESQ